ncbi:MAG TPA: hypothetical protein VFO54_01845 [Chryseosolibacter sp.]|nr:hypothetical protein [Chryseosolibacter sp.]
MNFQGKTLTCKLSTPELQLRRATIIRSLKELVLKKEDIDGGLRFTFDGTDEVLDKLLDFIKSERLCCDFLGFHLSIEGETATLKMTGPEGTREFLEHEVGF